METIFFKCLLEFLKVTWSMLMEDIANMVIFLNRVTRNEDSNDLEGWMFLFINIICEGIQFINWAEIISDNLCDQLLKLKDNHNFYMTSYLFYAIAGMKKWPGLNVEGIYDDMTQIYNYHPQMQLEESYHHFRRINDAFTMLTVREL